MVAYALTFFSPAFNIFVNDPFHWSSTSSKTEHGLSVTFANSSFAIAFTLSSILWNVVLMKHSSSSSRIKASNLFAYLHEPWNSRKLAILSGIICALGNALQFHGASIAGFAAADMVQAFPLVGTIWDVLIFEEFKNATRHVCIALFLMYATYICGILFLAESIAV